MAYNSIKNRIKTSYLVVWFRVFLSKLQESFLYSKSLCVSDIYHDSMKMKTHLTIATHALEKGMSIGNARYGFGQPKALELIDGLQFFLSIGGDVTFVNESSAVINSYLEYNEQNGADMSNVRKAFELFCQKNAIELVPYGGIEELKHSDIKEKENSPFDVFSQSRYAIRDYGKSPIMKETVEKALKLCERTPTACNRQSQRVHVYLNREQKDKLLRLQGGGRGFIEDIQGAILICSDLRCYDFFELNLPYVDGGLYAMNLLYALHYHDVATIPLTMGHKTKYTKKLMKAMNLPSHEVPVLLIGIGSFKDIYRVAQSHRSSWKEYTEIVDR